MRSIPWSEKCKLRINIKGAINKNKKTERKSQDVYSGTRTENNVTPLDWKRDVVLKVTRIDKRMMKTEKTCDNNNEDEVGSLDN